MGNYCVCWRDKDGYDIVLGEEGMDSWAEAEEVCDAYRADQDGLEYYVGYPEGTPAAPGMSEALDLIEDLRIDGFISRAEHKMLEYLILFDGIEDPEEAEDWFEEDE